MIQEIKRIIKESEILKYVVFLTALLNYGNVTGTDNDETEKTTRNGLKRTKMADRSWRFDWGASTSRLRYAIRLMEYDVS